MHLELLVVIGAQGNKIGVNVNLIKYIYISTYIIYITQFLNIKFILCNKIMFISKMYRIINENENSDMPIIEMIDCKWLRFNNTVYAIDINIDYIIMFLKNIESDMNKIFKELD